MTSLLGGIFLGWSLGANDAANVFGTAVASRMVRFRTAAALAAVFILAGSVISGRPTIKTLAGLTDFSLEQAVISSVGAAVTVSGMTLLGLPVSTSQAVVGSIVGIGILNRQINTAGLAKVVACWFGTPIGSALISILLFWVLSRLYNAARLTIFESDIMLRLLLVAAGSYGSYSLGANNVANVTAVFVDAGRLNVLDAAILGGVSIALGVVTLSRPVMETVGRKLVRLDAFSALIVVMAVSATLHLYTLIGVPVSSSQAAIGAVLGIGLIKGINTIDKKKFFHILMAWFLTPAFSCAVSLLIFFVIHLRYIPD